MGTTAALLLSLAHAVLNHVVERQRAIAQRLQRVNVALGELVFPSFSHQALSAVCCSPAEEVVMLAAHRFEQPIHHTATVAVLVGHDAVKALDGRTV